MGAFERITSSEENEWILQVFFSVEVLLACQKRVFVGLRRDDKYVSN